MASSRHYKRVNTWRCSRHDRPNEVLSIQNQKIESITQPSQTGYTEVGYERRRVATGVYWGHTGFLYGPGFKAWAADFPVGTRLKVTAEIILPAYSLDNSPFDSPELG